MSPFPCGSQDKAPPPAKTDEQEENSCNFSPDEAVNYPHDEDQVFGRESIANITI